MDAIVTAGGIPLPEDPLYIYTEGHSKALLDIAGKPMIQWVLDALSAAEKVDNVIIIGLGEKIGVTCSKPTYYLSNQGRMLANIVAGVEKSLELNPQTEHVLIVSSDIPALSGEMVDWLVDEIEKVPADIYYGVIPREVMDKRYPNSRRTWTRLKEMEICGADINACHVSMATEHLDLWENLIGNRKSPLKQIAAVGWDTALLLIFRKLTIDELVQRVAERLGIKGKAIVWPWAEAGMDVDKPHQLEMMREDLESSKLFKRILELDRDWSYALRVAEKPGLLRNFAMFFAHSGDSWFWGLALVSLWFLADLFWKRWAVYELWWIAILAAIVMTLKFVIKRRRPEGEWGAIYRNTDPHSFPSGHAARSFLIAVLATFLGPGWLAVILWIWAPLVSIARVAMGVHYLSDVVAGALVGSGVALVGMPLAPAIFTWISQLLMPFWGFGLW